MDEYVEFIKYEILVILILYVYNIFVPGCNFNKYPFRVGQS